jgi:hypothetical protein
MCGVVPPLYMVGRVLCEGAGLMCGFVPPL